MVPFGSICAQRKANLHWEGWWEWIRYDSLKCFPKEKLQAYKQEEGLVVHPLTDRGGELWGFSTPIGTHNYNGNK